MKNARNGHNHSLQAWYNRITNLRFECFYTPLVRGRLPLRPRIKKEKDSAKIQENYLLKKDWRYTINGDNKNIPDT